MFQPRTEGIQIAKPVSLKRDEKSAVPSRDQIPPGKSELRWVGNQFENKIKMKIISSMLAAESKVEFLKQTLFFVTPPALFQG